MPDSPRPRRSIPAHAGEPDAEQVVVRAQGVYPRPRGGTPPPRAGMAGLSGVYPRPRGGTADGEHEPREVKGLSPPTRGNPIAPRRQPLARRSIPAHAGEPSRAIENPLGGKVYPRPRGGTVVVQSVRAPRAPPPGLSPPTRGNLKMRSQSIRVNRSIPAHAGEPATRPLSRRNRAVYPRPRGGTVDGRAGVLVGDGLSPPTRGNREAADPPRTAAGSIPAHAGEPHRRVRLVEVEGVYPRPRGGTPKHCRPPLCGRGLSPPTRGNLVRRRAGDRNRGSIPAHAGEPANHAGNHHGAGVYPRPRGGTAEEARAAPPDPGLSPPTRGNPAIREGVDGFVRSIPAHAGEPSV